MFEDDEEWKASTYQYYEVSNKGNVRSIDRYIFRSGALAPIFVHGKLLKTQIDRNGYVKLRISINSIKYTMSVHREVALAFLHKDTHKNEVNHKDGNKSNNNIANLEWVTRSENLKHAVSTGLRTLGFGKSAISSKKKILVFKGDIPICELIGTRAVTEFGLDYRLVHRCLKGLAKTHKGFNFKEVPL